MELLRNPLSDFTTPPDLQWISRRIIENTSTRDAPALETAA